MILTSQKNPSLKHNRNYQTFSHQSNKNKTSDTFCKLRKPIIIHTPLTSPTSLVHASYRIPPLQSKQSQKSKLKQPHYESPKFRNPKTLTQQNIIFR